VKSLEDILHQGAIFSPSSQKNKKIKIKIGANALRKLGVDENKFELLQGWAHHCQLHYKSSMDDGYCTNW
jgi:hypothetical protein